MIYFDNEGFPRNETMDGMDSSVRAAMISIFFPQIREISLRDYEIAGGLLVRHPLHIPSNNFKNNTRDNMIPMITALWKAGHIDICRRVLWETIKRGGFAQNEERDIAGSTKHIYPHSFHKDSDPNKPIETRIFDHADPFFPDHLFHIVLCAEFWPLYWLGLIGIPFFTFSLFFHGRSDHKEHNQILCMCQRYGRWAFKLFNRWVPKWRDDMINYWQSRGEIEYANYTIQTIEGILNEK